MSLPCRLALSLRLPLLGLSLLLCLTGCHSSRSETPPSPPVAPSLRQVSFSPSPIQAQPLYHQAQQACRDKQFTHAAQLLQQLAASPDWSPAEREFCLQQRALCLQHLASPAERHSTVLPAAAPAVLSPADADCGPRALALVSERLGTEASVERLRRIAGTTGKGTSMAGLAKAAQSLGLKAEGVQVSREALSQVELPAIAWINQAHYVALLSVSGEGEEAVATIHDPNKAQEETLPRERLLRLCSGYLLLVHR